MKQFFIESLYYKIFFFFGKDFVSGVLFVKMLDLGLMKISWKGSLFLFLAHGEDSNPTGAYPNHFLSLWGKANLN